MPYCDTSAMQAHLHEISAAVAPGAHAILILDQAGWHLSSRLIVPHNITLLPLPPFAFAIVLTPVCCAAAGTCHSIYHTMTRA